MEKTAFWKQAVAMALLLGAVALGWQNREPLAEAWAAVVAPPSADVGTQRSRQGTPVIVEPVRTMRDDVTFTAIGTGHALRSVTLRAPSGGEITELAVAPGHKFDAGDVLMRLDDTDQRLALNLAEARLDNATAERDRYLQLQNTGAAATARVEQAQTEFRVAEIELEQARAALADRILRAPFDGVSGLPEVEMGDRVSGDAEVSTYDDRSRILVEFDLPEALLSRVSVGLALTATTPAADGRKFDGEVTGIDSRVDPVTRTSRVQAAIDNASDELRPGASFSIRLELPGRVYPAVPELALQFSRGSMYVWRVEDTRAEQVDLRMVRRRGGMVIVDGPLSEGQSVVVEGTQRLRPDAEVDVLNAPGNGST